ncbi:uncharacterized protein [Solanum lycopersicum]|uniref:uncharacterized protein n=1 Tax=Solanum lycopersicum TaxID=4081 RepID=UPI0037494534
MNTRGNAVQRLQEEILNAGAPPRGDQVPSLEEEANVEQASVNPPPLMDVDIRASLILLAQAVITQSLDMTDQNNREVIPHPNQQVIAIASCLRDFTRMNPPTFYGSKVKEDPQEFFDDVYKILLDMGLSTSEKAELATYQLKDGDQEWEMREAKVVVFINLLQGGMSVHEYSLKFTKLSKYAPSLVFDPRDEMRRFVMGVLDDLQEECHSSMLHENMNNSRLMVHDKHVEEARAKRKIRYAKSSRSFDGAYEGKGTSSPIEKTTCGRCGKKHYSDCLKGTDNFFSCGKSGHKVRDFPNVRGQDEGSCKAQASCSNEAPNKNNFYALHSRGKQETYPDVVTGCLWLVGRVQGLNSEIPSIAPVPIVSEYVEVFPNDLPGIPPEREIDFGIDFLVDTNPMSIPPYRIAPAEFKELNAQLKYLLDKGFIRRSISPWGAPIVFVKKKDGSL